MTAGPRMGFFTDTSVCIGCKACEVACKEWNLTPQDGPLSLSANSYDNTMPWGPAPGATSPSASNRATTRGWLADELGRVQALQLGRVP